MKRYKQLFENTSDSPRIYVADLAAYNNGHLKGQWLNLLDFHDGHEVMKAIDKIIGPGNEYAIHDFEGFPRSFYHESMGEDDFDKIIQLTSIEDELNLPMSVALQYAEEYLPRGWSVDDLKDKLQDSFRGAYNSAADYMEELATDAGISDEAYSMYAEVYPGDIDMIASEEADNARENGSDDEEADRIEQEWKDGLKSDPFSFLVDDQGVYSREDLIQLIKSGKIPWITIDYKAMARDEEINGAFSTIEADGKVYIFDA